MDSLKESERAAQKRFRLMLSLEVGVTQLNAGYIKGFVDKL